MELLRQIAITNLTVILFFVALARVRTGVKEWNHGNWQMRLLSASLNFGVAGWFLYLTFINGRLLFILSDKPTFYFYLAAVVLLLDVLWAIWLWRWFKKNKQSFIDWYRKGNLLRRPRPKEENYKAWF